MKTSLRPFLAVVTLLATLSFGAQISCGAEPEVGGPSPARQQAAPNVVLTRTPLTVQEFAKYQRMDARLRNQHGAGADDHTVLWVAVGVAVVVGIVVIASSHHGGMGGGY
ncbi:MAG TPA: hypothetical protein VMI53_04245 [Opitutaceae bacterium]|nr:hypothetical protein [Opitutaceae bacterium]